MTFATPWLLLLLLVVPATGVAAVFLRARREKALAHLTLHPPKAPLAGLQTACALVGLALVLVAAARPRWGLMDDAEKIVRLSRKAVIVLDVSRSMLAEDVGSRLAQAKTGAAELVKGLLDTNDVTTAGGSCALVTFSGHGRILSPLTDDRAFLERAIANLSELSAEPGRTSLAEGLEDALSLLPEGPEAEHRTVRDSVIVLLSDGGDLEGRALEAADKAKSRGVPILAVGVGRSDADSPIPLSDGRMLLDERGNVVRVKLEAETLRAVADRSGGRYVELAALRAGDMAAGRTLYDTYNDFIHRVAEAEQAEEEQRAGTRLRERFQWFLIPGLALLIACAACSKGRILRSRPAARAPGQ